MLQDPRHHATLTPRTVYPQGMHLISHKKEDFIHEKKPKPGKIKLEAQSPQAAC